MGAAPPDRCASGETDHKISGSSKQSDPPRTTHPRPPVAADRPPGSSGKRSRPPSRRPRPTRPLRSRPPLPPHHPPLPANRRRLEPRIVRVRDGPLVRSRQLIVDRFRLVLAVGREGLRPRQTGVRQILRVIPRPDLLGPLRDRLTRQGRAVELRPKRLAGVVVHGFGKGRRRSNM